MKFLFFFLFRIIVSPSFQVKLDILILVECLKIYQLHFPIMLYLQNILDYVFVDIWKYGNLILELSQHDLDWVSELGGHEFWLNEYLFQGC